MRRDSTGKKERKIEPYVEDLASYNGRESCGGCREAIIEALTAVRTGPVIELRNIHQDADPLCVVGRQYGTVRNRKFGAGPAESKTCGMCGTFLRENRETPRTPDEVLSFGRDGKAKSRNLSMYVPWESDADIVPTKPLNKTEESAAEGAEGRSAAAGNLTMQTGAGSQYPDAFSPGIGRVRALARKEPKLRFVNLMHHITPRLLHEAYLDLKKDAAPGVDVVTWDEYGEVGNYVKKIKDLHERVQSGLYRALPSKCIYIPKADGRQRPIGIAAIEDKIVQKAMVWVLEAIYEEDFHNFSYGFCPERNQHKALDAVWMAITNRKVGWILDADIKGFFDNIDHQWMLKFLEHRISDQRVLTLIRKKFWNAHPSIAVGIDQAQRRLIALQTPNRTDQGNP